ncbi:hypothetical protein D9M68_903510 [compost metagenome]
MFLPAQRYLVVSKCRRTRPPKKLTIFSCTLRSGSFETEILKVGLVADGASYPLMLLEKGDDLRCWIAR